MGDIKCSSCNKSIANDSGSVDMPCPKCAEHKIIRCTDCRKLAAKYKCPGCGFEGPN